MAKLRLDAEEQDRTSIHQTPDKAVAEPPMAWEQIENGRYMPRRIRGSFRGRELG
jgi:hypothetical protein